MKRMHEKQMVKPDQNAADESEKPTSPRECSSPPCYAHEFPGYFGEIEEDRSAQQPPKKQNG